MIGQRVSNIVVSKINDPAYCSELKGLKYNCEANGLTYYTKTLRFQKGVRVASE